MVLVEFGPDPTCPPHQYKEVKQHFFSFQQHRLRLKHYEEGPKHELQKGPGTTRFL